MTGYYRQNRGFKGSHFVTRRTNELSSAITSKVREHKRPIEVRVAKMPTTTNLSVDYTVLSNSSPSMIS